MQWSGRRVVLGVSGGIACYKSCTLARQLMAAGAEVDVVMTRAAAQFVTPLTFESLTGRPVLVSLWTPGHALQHVRLGERADVVIVAPATANVIARMAQGAADDLLSTLLLASHAPVLLAPAMNDEMYADSATQENLSVLAARGIAIAGPVTGPLAEGPSDRPGRMLEPEEIMRHAERLLSSASSPLRGRRVLVTGGPTREAIDPVRVLSNRSTGRMGIALAEAAWSRGAEVTLILGPSSLVPHGDIELRRIDSTRDLLDAVSEAIPSADVCIMAAAPADFGPAAPSADRKISREGQGAHELALVPTPDILRATRELRSPGALIVGFSLETGAGEDRARQKLESKGLDLIVLNDQLEPGAGLEVETNRVVVLGRDGARDELPFGTKREVSEGILDLVEQRLV